MSKAITVYIEMTNNPICYKFVINRILIENGFKLFQRESKNIEECNLVIDLFDMYSEITEIFIAANFISISFTLNFEITEDYLEAIKNIINVHINISNSFLNQIYIEELIKIRKCIDEYINPALEMDGGLFVINKYSKKHRQLIIQTIGSCRNNPSINIDLEQTKNIINRVCNLEIKHILPIIIK